MKTNYKALTHVVEHTQCMSLFKSKEIYVAYKTKHGIYQSCYIIDRNIEILFTELRLAKAIQKIHEKKERK